MAVIRFHSGRQGCNHSSASGGQPQQNGADYFLSGCAVLFCRQGMEWHARCVASGCQYGKVGEGLFALFLEVRTYPESRQLRRATMHRPSVYARSTTTSGGFVGMFPSGCGQKGHRRRCPPCQGIAPWLRPAPWRVTLLITTHPSKTERTAPYSSVFLSKVLAASSACAACSQAWAWAGASCMKRAKAFETLIIFSSVVADAMSLFSP